MSGFRDTDDFEKGWNPNSTGSKKNKDFKELKPTDKSYIIGYYQGSRQVKNEKNANQPYILHKILATEIGDPSHSPKLENKDGELREFFGTAVINKKLAEKCQVGQLVKIQWVGKVESKNGGVPYHDWKLFIDESAAPRLAGNAPTNTAAGETAETKTEGKTESAATTSDEDDPDDLPF